MFLFILGGLCVLAGLALLGRVVFLVAKPGHMGVRGFWYLGTVIVLLNVAAPIFLAFAPEAETQRFARAYIAFMAAPRGWGFIVLMIVMTTLLGVVSFFSFSDTFNVGRSGISPHVEPDTLEVGHHEPAGRAKIQWDYGVLLALVACLTGFGAGYRWISPVTNLELLVDSAQECAKKHPGKFYGELYPDFKFVVPVNEIKDDSLSGALRTSLEAQFKAVGIEDKVKIGEVRNVCFKEMRTADKKSDFVAFVTYTNIKSLPTMPTSRDEVPVCMTVLYYDMQNVDEWAKKWKALLDGINEGNQMESAKLSELKSAVGFPSGPTLINTTIPAPGTSITIGTTPVKK